MTTHKTRPDKAPAPPAAAAPAPTEAPRVGPAGAWVRFWFTPADPIGLHAVRVLAGLLFLSWLLPFAGSLEAFFSLNGWLDQQGLRDTVGFAGGGNPPWSVLYLIGDNLTAVTAVYWTSVAVLVLFTLGLWPRVTAVLTWVVVASFTASPALWYEGDALLQMFAFYLMVGYVLMGQWNGGLSLKERLLGPAGCCSLTSYRAPSVGANVALRLLQVHFALTVLMTGLHKLQFGDWWAGVALWFPLHPPFETKLADVLANKAYADWQLGWLNVATYATLAWQIGFPAFAWKRLCRPLLIGGGVVAWVACAWLYRAPLVGPAFFVGCLAYLTADEWARTLAWFPSRSCRAAADEPAARSVPTGAAVAGPPAR